MKMPKGAFVPLAVAMMMVVFVADATNQKSSRQGITVSTAGKVTQCMVVNQKFRDGGYDFYRNRQCLVDDPLKTNKNKVCQTSTDPFREKYGLKTYIPNTNCSPGTICCQGISEQPL